MHSFINFLRLKKNLSYAFWHPLGHGDGTSSLVHRCLMFVQYMYLSTESRDQSVLDFHSQNVTQHTFGKVSWAFLIFHGVGLSNLSDKLAIFLNAEPELFAELCQRSPRKCTVLSV